MQLVNKQCKDYLNETANDPVLLRHVLQTTSGPGALEDREL